MRERLCVSLLMLALATVCCSASSLADEVVLTNPYQNVDWQTFHPYRADLHVHTLQSDGCHLVNEVVGAFHDAGFDILAITDHDLLAPNFCPQRNAATPSDFGAFATEPTPYPDTKPPTFPANPTWPWVDFGAPAPASLGMLGIEGAELTCSYHVNSYFSDYGVPPPCNGGSQVLNEKLLGVARKGGLAVLNHPDTSQPPEWFVQLYRDHSAESFVGIEIAADAAAVVDSYVTVWDQVLGELMPARPVWGFGTSDMHMLARTRFAFTVFLLDEPTAENVKEAMQGGQFYSVIGPRSLNLSRDRGQVYDGPEAYDGTYPELRSISVDRDAGTISVDASGYDEIVWISQPVRRVADAETPWPSGEIVQRGPVFDYARGDRTLRYVRAEVIRQTDDGPIRLFVNPFGLLHP